MSSLAGKVDKNALTSLNLRDNKIIDASALAPIGAGDGALGNPSSLSAGLDLANNRITDFSAFADWLQPPTGGRVTGQSIYVGPYRAAGVTVTLKTADATAPAVSPAEAGAYDATKGTLTIADPSADSVQVTPNWTVFFTNPPADPGDENGPTISGTPQVGQVLTVSDLGAAFANSPCTTSTLKYRWLRDSEEFAGNLYATAGLIGGPGTSPRYMVSPTDLGHQLSVQVTCEQNSVRSTSAPTATVTASEPGKPAIQPLEGDVDPARTRGIDARAGVAGDPTNPTFPIYVAQLDDSGKLVDPAQLRVTATVINSTSDTFTADDIQIRGTGAERRVVITPEEALSATVQVTVTGTTGKTATWLIPYRVSVATTPTSRVLIGSSDASSAIAVGDGYLMVGDDESPAIELFDATTSSMPVASFQLTGTAIGEIDLESSVRKGNTIWWFGSHGNAKDGGQERTRQTIIQTTLTGTGAKAQLKQTGVAYPKLREDLIEWDRLVNHDALGLAAGAQRKPDDINGFNIEGVEFSPDDRQLYLAFRSPIVPAQPGGKALIVPVTNFEDLTSGAATKATFGEPILLDLGGDSIREIRKNGRDEYLILSAPAGPSKTAPTQTLWAWTGDPAIAPQKLTTVLPKDVEPTFTDNQGVWEGIGEMPERLVPGAKVRLIMDQGYDILYESNFMENKDNDNPFTRKARTDEVVLEGPVGTLASLSDLAAFPNQTANTIGAAQEVTVTNTGSNLLHVGSVYTEDADEASADDFLISTNTCSGKALKPTESCVVHVRFAPARQDVTSNAKLVIDSDVPGGRSTVALTGRSVAAGNPLKAGTPSISGTAQVGSKLTAKPGNWTGGTTLTYKWTRDGEAIEGATSSTYTLVAADAGKMIAVEVTGTKPGYATATRSAEAVVVKPATLKAGAPKITGTVAVGKKLTAEPGNWTAGTQLAYQWTRDGKAIEGATSSTYTPVADDAGKQIAVKVTGSLAGYTTVTATSPAKQIKN